MNIYIQNGSKSFGSRKLFNKVNLKIKSNEFVMITGKSGCGKTTLLKCMSGNEQLDEGNIFYDNLELSAHKDLLNTSIISLVTQDNMLLSECTNKELIKISNNIKSSKFDKEWYTFLIKTLNIENIVDKYPSECSIGEQQRVSLAKALITKPKVLLLDEPTGNLDEQNTIIFMELLSKLRKIHDCTIVMVTHEISLYKYANRIIDLTKPINDSLLRSDETYNLQKIKQKKLWILSLISSFYQFHFFKSLLVISCISFVFISSYLAINAGDMVKEYIYNYAYNYPSSTEIRISNNSLISEKECNELEKIDYITEISTPNIKLLYGYERYDGMYNKITIEDRTIQDTDLEDGLFLHGTSYESLIAGDDNVEGTNLVLSSAIVDELGYSYTEVLNKKINYEFPYVYGFVDSLFYDAGIQDVYKDKMPIMKMMKLEGYVTGVVKNDYYDLFIDSNTINEIVVNQIKKDRELATTISPFDQEKAIVKIDSIDNLSKALIFLRSKGYNCDNDTEYLINSIEAIDKQANIYKLIFLFTFIAIAYVLYLVVQYINSFKKTIIIRLKSMGANSKQIIQYIIYDNIFLFIITSIFSICLTIIILPFLNKVFTFMNHSILLLEMTFSESIPFFNFTLNHLVICISFIAIIIFFIMIHLFDYLRRNIIC